MAKTLAASTPPVTRNGTSRPRRYRRRPGGLVNLFYVPALAIFAVFTVYPLLTGVGFSLTNWDGYSPDSSFVGLSNFVRLLQDSNFRMVLLNTVIYGFGSMVFQQILGLALALALNRRGRASSTVRAIVYLPALVSPVIMGIMYYLLFQYNDGTFNDIVVAFGGERIAWFGSAASGVALIVAVNTLQFVGISMIIYLAGLQAIPEMYYEASSLDGAGYWRQFTSITVPMLQPAFATSIVFNLIGGLKLFDVIKVMTSGGPGYSTHSVSTFIGVVYFDQQSAGYASAMGVVLFVLILGVTLALNTILNRRRLEA